MSFQSRPIGRTLALALILVALPCGVLAQDDPPAGPKRSSVTLGLPPHETSVEAISETEGAMNCFEVRFVPSGLRAILPNFPDTGPELAYQSRRLAKSLLPEAVLDNPTVLNAHLAAGTLYGIEYDWYFAPMSRPALSETVDVYLEGGDGAPSLLATVYGFDRASYVSHKAAVEAMIGHPMETFVVWEGDLVDLEGRGLLSVSGSRNELHGPVSTPGSVELLGARNALLGNLTLGGELVRGGDNRVAFVRHATPLASASPDPGALLHALRQAAMDRGAYYPAGAVLTAAELPASGVVFAEGDLVLEGSGRAGAWTFVSASGNVELRGEDLTARPFVRHDLVLAPRGDVVLGGRGALLLGRILAPDGVLELTGSYHTLLGTFVGAGAALAGSGNVLTDGTLPLHLP